MVETFSHSFYESSITKIVPISYYFIKARLLSIKFAIQLKKWCVVNLTNRWLPIVYKQFIDVSQNLALFFIKARRLSIKFAIRLKKWSEVKKPSSLSVDKMLYYQLLIQKINIGVNNNEKCFWTPLCFKNGIIIFCGSNYGIQLNVYSSWQASVTQTYLNSTCKIRNTIFFCA